MLDTEKTYTLNDLYNWDYNGTSLAVIGDPVDRSLSPVMFNTAFIVMSRSNESFKDWRYFKFFIQEEDLAEALKVFYRKQFLGLNLTMPHKVEAMKYIASIDEVAKRMGAVNSLVLDEHGYRGFNTDGYGLELAIKTELKTSFKNKDIIILGAGGAAKAAAVQCLLADCNSVWIGNRSEEHLAEILKTVGIMGEGRAQGFKLSKPPKNLPKTGILINATSLGMEQNDPSPISLEHFDASLRVFDMTYNPPQTRLLKMANEHGMKHSNGLSMLVGQGAKALQTWAGVSEVPIETMWNAANDCLKENALDL